MIDKICFIALFLAANIKYVDILYGMANLHKGPVVCMYVITYALSFCFWFLFPHKSVYALKK